MKGDGSDHLGGIELIWNGDYATRYAYSFPIDSTEWKQVFVPWRDLIPELSKTTQVLDAKTGNAPSKLGPIAFGKWWCWKDYAAHSYTIDEIRLEPVIALDTKEYRPAGLPLARVLAKLKAGKPITILTMGDSLTDANHWTNKDVNWPLLFKANVKAKYGSDLTSCPPLENGAALGDLATACRLATKAKNAGLSDIYSVFSAVPQAEKARLYVEDKVHFSWQGQELAARTVLHSVDQAGR